MGIIDMVIGPLKKLRFDEKLWRSSGKCEERPDYSGLTTHFSPARFTRQNGHMNRVRNGSGVKVQMF
ncbi:hypothetical protein J0X12_03230 [Sneathiella sp. CAU 1612]|uniref:Uncharacterized protein n=1 Tax=Sneathiella sedimenti TaxID=2816034 RepID=A0ABS3F266_9PROT|nr:hypothetical protein [Sneathiella sedimenti]MBO0332610.1 hypothetical protein [Sneathiella sedimenti]